MFRPLYILLLGIFLISADVMAQEDTLKQPKRANRPHFIDLDGDGFNDLAPDSDGDGIPDGLDQDTQAGQDRWRWGWLRNMPDSALVDSNQFRDWWENEQQQKQRPVNWRAAWLRVQRTRELMRQRGMQNTRWWNRPGFDPRRQRLRSDINRRRGRGRRNP